jgi:hypothetical protein
MREMKTVMIRNKKGKRENNNEGGTHTHTHTTSATSSKQKEKKPGCNSTTAVLPNRSRRV